MQPPTLKPWHTRCSASDGSNEPPVGFHPFGSKPTRQKGEKGVKSEELDVRPHLGPDGPKDPQGQTGPNAHGKGSVNRSTV